MTPSDRAMFIFVSLIFIFGAYLSFTGGIVTQDQVATESNFVVKYVLSSFSLIFGGLFLVYGVKKDS